MLFTSRSIGHLLSCKQFPEMSQYGAKREITEEDEERALTVGRLKSWKKQLWLAHCFLTEEERAPKAI